MALVRGVEPDVMLQATSKSNKFYVYHRITALRTHDESTVKDLARLLFLILSVRLYTQSTGHYGSVQCNYKTHKCTLWAEGTSSNVLMLSHWP